MKKPDMILIVPVFCLLSVILAICSFVHLTYQYGYSRGHSSGLKYANCQYDEYVRVVRASLDGNNMPYHEFMEKWYGPEDD